MKIYYPILCLVLVGIFYSSTQAQYTIYDFNDGPPTDKTPDEGKEGFGTAIETGGGAFILETDDGFDRYYRVFYRDDSVTPDGRAELPLLARLPTDTDWSLIFVAASLPLVNLTGTTGLGGEIRLARSGGTGSNDDKIVYGISGASSGSSLLLKAFTEKNESSLPITDELSIWNGPFTFKYSYEAGKQSLTLTLGTASWNVTIPDRVHINNTTTNLDVWDIAKVSFLDASDPTAHFANWNINPSSDEFEFVLFGESIGTRVTGNGNSFWFVYTEGAKEVVNPISKIIAEFDAPVVQYPLDPVTGEPTNLDPFDLLLLDNDIVLPPIDKTDVVITGLSRTIDGPRTQALVSGGGGAIAITSEGANPANFDKQVTYVPGPGFAGTDIFYYDISDNALNTSTAEVHVYVNAPLRLDYFAYAFYNLIVHWLKKSLFHDELVFQLERLKPKIIRILIENPDLAGDLVDSTLASDEGGKFSTKEFDGGFQTNDFSVGGGGIALDLYNAYQPGLAALFAGQGETQTITQEMINLFKSFRDGVYEHADQELRDFIDTQSAEWNDMQVFVGMSFNEWAEELGMNPEELAVWPFTISFENESFTVSLQDTQGIDFILIKTDHLSPADWQPVEGVVVTNTDGMIHLTDPNPGTEKAFYRVEMNLASNGQN